MKTDLFSKNIRKGLAALSIATACLPLLSCDRLHETLPECNHGARIRFVYDYNMEFANAFPSQVDCLTVLFYKADGTYIKTELEVDSENLSDENWRMDVELEAGTYNIIAYGGMECSESSFTFTPMPGNGVPMTDVEVELKPSCITSPTGTRLHDLFYGKADVSVSDADMDFQEVTVYMMKDTNNLRILLQQVDGTPINEADFDFKITDDNTLMAWNNDVISTKTTEYLPWSRGNASPGELPDDKGEATVCWAEFSFPRLITSNSPRLIITAKETGKTVVNIPLINYLLLLKSDIYANMGSQEFLDRESRWKMLFFLNGNIWITTVIEINDWIVRINDVNTDN